jgi:hypothetical protein
MSSSSARKQVPARPLARNRSRDSGIASKSLQFESNLVESIERQLALMSSAAAASASSAAAPHTSGSVLNALEHASHQDISDYSQDNSTITSVVLASHLSNDVLSCAVAAPAPAAAPSHAAAHSAHNRVDAAASPALHAISMIGANSTRYELEAATGSNMQPQRAVAQISIAPPSPVDLIASIETKLALLGNAIHSDKLKKRAAGAPGAKAARATGRADAAAAPASAQQLQSPGTTAASVSVPSPAAAGTSPQHARSLEPPQASAADAARKAATSASESPEASAGGAASAPLHEQPQSAPVVAAAAASDQAPRTSPAACSEAVDLSVGDAAPPSPVDLIASIETKLALLGNAIHSDKLKKRAAGAPGAKAARAAGRADAAAAPASAQQLQSPGTTAASAPAASATIAPLPSPSASASAILIPSDVQHDHANQISHTHVEHAAAAPPPASATRCRHDTFPATAPSQSPPFTTTGSSSVPPLNNDLFSSIEANLQRLSSVVVPSQFKKRALGTRLQPARTAAVVPANGHVAAARSSAAPAPKASSASKVGKSSAMLSSKVKSTVSAASAASAAAAAAAAADIFVPQSSSVTNGIIKLQARTRGMLTRKLLSQRADQPPASSKEREEAGAKAAEENPLGARARAQSAAGDSKADTFAADAACDDDESAAAAAVAAAAAAASFVIAGNPHTDIHHPTTAAQATPPPSRPFGLSLEKDQASAGYVVASIAPSSPASAEPHLKKGTLVLQLNGQACKGLAPQQVDDLLQGRGCSELRVTVKKGWLWGTTTAVLRRAEEQLDVAAAAAAAAAAASSLPANDKHAADAANFDADAGRLVGDPNLELDEQLRSRAAIAVVAHELAAKGDGGAGGGSESGGDDTCDGGSVVALPVADDACDGGSVVALPVAAVNAVPLLQPQTSEVDVGIRGSSSSSSSIKGGGYGRRSSAIMSAVEQNLALLRDRMQQEKRAEQQQLSRRTTDARARIALVAHASATSRGTRALNPEPVMLLNRSPRARGGDGAGTAVQDVGVDDVTGELADDSVQKVMMKRLGEGGLSGLAAPAAAAVAEAAISSASRQKINDDRERADRAALAEVVARQSALTLEARAVIAGGGRGCAQLLQACSCTLPRFVVPSAISLTRLQ